MDILNETPFACALALGPGPEGQPLLGIVVKATFVLPSQGEPTAHAAPEQLPVLLGDEADPDHPDLVRFEADAVAFKPRADVVLVGRAYAPRGQSTRSVDVVVRVGQTAWTIRVFGDRRWIFPTRLAVVPTISDPIPFVEMSLVYARAYGGIDEVGADWCRFNLAGRGFIARKKADGVDDVLLPNLENMGHPIRSWDDRPFPAGFGFFGRGWQPRLGFVGSDFEQPDPVFGLPGDFSVDFFNGAHPALQIPGYLRGDEEVELRNVTPDGLRRFRLPGIRPTVTLGLYEGNGAAPSDAPDSLDEALEDTDEPTEEPSAPTRDVDVAMSLDTLVLVPDEGVLYAVWRGGHQMPGESLDAITDYIEEQLAYVRVGLA